MLGGVDDNAEASDEFGSDVRAPLVVNASPLVAPAVPTAIDGAAPPATPQPARLTPWSLGIELYEDFARVFRAIGKYPNLRTCFYVVLLDSLAEQTMVNLALLYLPATAVFGLMAIGAIMFYRLDRAGHEANLAKLEEELAGLSVVDPAGVVLGEVVGLDVGAAQDRLRIRLTDGVEALVPFVEALVPEVDIAPPGLLDLARES